MTRDFIAAAVIGGFTVALYVYALHQIASM